MPKPKCPPPKPKRTNWKREYETVLEASIASSRMDGLEIKRLETIERAQQERIHWHEQRDSLFEMRFKEFERQLEEMRGAEISAVMDSNKNWGLLRDERLKVQHLQRHLKVIAGWLKRVRRPWFFGSPTLTLTPGDMGILRVIAEDSEREQ